MRVLCILAGASIALTTTGAAAAADPKAPPQEDKVVCKRQQEADTGSHFAAPKKICMKKSEWRQLEQGVENSLDRLRQQGGACLTCLTPGSTPGGDL